MKTESIWDRSATSAKSAFKDSRVCSAKPMAQLTEQSEEIHAGDEPDGVALSNVEEVASETWMVADELSKRH